MEHETPNADNPPVNQQRQPQVELQTNQRAAERRPRPGDSWDVPNNAGNGNIIHNRGDVEGTFQEPVVRQEYELSCRNGHRTPLDEATARRLLGGLTRWDDGADSDSTFVPENQPTINEVEQACETRLPLTPLSQRPSGSRIV